MKYIILSSLASLIMASCTVEVQPEKEARKEIIIKKEVSEVEEGSESQSKVMASIGIEGMTCPMGCARKIENTLKDKTGVKFCAVNFEDKTAEIEYDDQVISEDDMVKTIESCGDFQVTEIKVMKTVVKEKEAV